MFAILFVPFFVVVFRAAMHVLMREKKNTVGTKSRSGTKGAKTCGHDFLATRYIRSAVFCLSGAIHIRVELYTFMFVCL